MQHHVLVVDDNEINLLVARKQLERLGYRATTVASGHEALVAIETDVFDIILMDCQMPGMDGYETARRIRLSEQARNQKRVPIVALTSFERSSVLPECLAAGMDDHIDKPIALVDFKKRLRAIIS